MKKICVTILSIAMLFTMTGIISVAAKDSYTYVRNEDIISEIVYQDFEDLEPMEDYATSNHKPDHSLMLTDSIHLSATAVTLWLQMTNRLVGISHSVVRILLTQENGQFISWNLTQMHTLWNLKLESMICRLVASLM